MAKIPFSIDYKPQIERGEYKVIDRFGYVLTLRDIINDVWYFSLCYPNTDYETERVYDHPENHLFLITPGPEFTEFEKMLWEIMKSEGSPIGLMDKFTQDDERVFHTYSEQLLKLAREEIVKSGYAIVESEHYLEEGRKNYERGKKEALKDLPMWRKWGNGACGNGSGTPIAIVKRWINDYKLVDALGIQGEQYIMLSDLEKLPKED